MIKMEKEPNIPLLYEYEIVRKHSENINTECFHWSNTPEDWLYEAGYITDFNKHRLERLLRKKEYKEGTNRLRDYGFDGMSKTIIDECIVYNGLQAKYYQEKSVTAEDIGTFLASQLSLYVKNNLSRGYLYTTSKLQADLAGFISNPAYPIKHIQYPWKEKNKEEPLKVNEYELSLRDYQKEALLQLEDKEGINALHIPCRMGKSLISGHHIKKLNPKTIIIIAPLKVSVDNLQERLECFFPEYTALLVDSDVDGTTNIDEIKSFIEKEGYKIIYSTYKSSIDILSEVIEDYEDYFILVDEVHNANEELCNFILNFNEGLVMSATLPEEIEDMLEINHTVYIPFSQGIKEGYITDYTLWLPYLIKNSDGSTNVDIDIPSEFSSFNKDLTAKALYLATVLLKTGSRKCIVYLSSQEECDLFTIVVMNIFKEYHGLTLWADKIDGTISKKKRKEILVQFEEKEFTTFCILSSVRILDEAIDIPKCDSVFITTVGERSSDIRMMQRSQRSSTLDKDNPSKRNNILLWAEGWEHCVESLNLLRESDPEFHKKVKIADANYDTNSNAERIELIKSELKEFIQWNTMKCISLDEKWELKRQEWIQFYEVHSRSPRNKAKDLNEKILGIWQGRQRGNYKKKDKCMTQERINVLNKISGWKWDEENSWEMHRQEWILFYEENKRYPIQSLTNIEEKKLCAWQNAQRLNYKRKKSFLTKERIEILNNTKNWVWENENKWEINRQKWLQFYEKNGRNPGKGRDDIEEKELGNWQTNQRKYFKNKDTRMTKERIEILNNTKNWVWKKEDLIETQIQKWINFFEENKRYPSNKSDDLLEKEIGNWQSDKLQRYRNKKLSQEYIDRLNIIPYWKWEVKQNK
jgi:superfamily II DNA or RNA helicase